MRIYRPLPLPFDPRHTRRWLAVVLASVMLHVIALYWADDNLRVSSSKPVEPAVMQAALHTIQPPVPVSPARKVSKPAARPALERPAPPPLPSAPSSALTTYPAEMPVVTLPADEAWDVFAEASLAEAEQAQGKAASSNDDAPYKFAPPPSAELKYDVQALRQGEVVYGRGQIGWQFDGNRYVISGEAGVLFITVLTFGSEGDTDAYGIAPLIYREKRFRRSETNTHFHRERQQISFSASTLSYPRKGGEQDRASIIWQLAALGRGDRERFVPNGQIPMFVAGVRDGETWNIEVIGEEEIEVGLGKMRAWHVARTPRQGSYEQKLDIWFAPEQNWYPVRLRYTEVNGDYLDMSVSTISAIQ